MAELVWNHTVADVPADARWLVDSQDLGDISDRLRWDLGIRFSWTRQYAGFFIIEDDNGFVYVAGTFTSVPWTHAAVEILYQEGEISPYADTVQT